jgi:formamidopyrimidine-DNA glycosylase
MPELPEVQTIANGLAKQLVGRDVESVDVLTPSSLHGEYAAPEAFAKALVGRRIVDIRRRAKLLLLEFDPPATLAVHLKMTGRLVVPAENETPLDKHARVLFRLKPKGEAPDRLIFHDVRRFGYCRLFKPGGLETWDFYAKLGPEPLELRDEAFPGLFAGRNTAIKALLLDQTVIAGIGNIYADESLFRAGIRPDARTGQISAARLRKLGRELREVLTEAIAACGSSIRNYTDANGDAGAFQNQFRVYGRAGETCVTCGAKLESKKVAGRTSVYCENCQK